ncbi:MAG: hypothetical protein HYX48_03230 [Chlamydiales bacterium]|nr:hypothetical protein [Chlamydiales bacterium]
MTSLKPVSSIIADFCGDNNGWDAEGLSRAVIGGVLINTNRPLLEIEGNPLPVRLQQLVVSYLKFDWEKSPIRASDLFVEDLCLRTEIASSRHFQSVFLTRWEDDSSIGIHNTLSAQPELEPVHSLTLGSELRSRISCIVSPEHVLTRWKKQDVLCLEKVGYTDQDLTKLLASCGQLSNLYIFESPRLFTLEFLSHLTDLTSLTLKLPQLRNEQPAHLVPLREVDLTKSVDEPPSFDLGKFNLPKLCWLRIQAWGPQLFVVDARRCSRLHHVEITLEGARKNGEYPTGRKFLYLSATDCVVDYLPKSIRIEGKITPDWLTVIREEPKKEESKNDSAARLPAGMSLS